MLLGDHVGVCGSRTYVTDKVPYHTKSPEEHIWGYFDENIGAWGFRPLGGRRNESDVDY